MPFRFVSVESFKTESPSSYTLKSIMLFVLRPYFPKISSINTWEKWNSYGGGLWLEDSEWLCLSKGCTGVSDASIPPAFYPHLFHLIRFVSWSDKSIILFQTFSFLLTDIFSNKFLACLVLSWCLLLRRPILIRRLTNSFSIPSLLRSVFLFS